ncbi:hypothetical protein K439DRAFT_1629366, partial [Ramaria rubella]
MHSHRFQKLRLSDQASLSLGWCCEASIGGACIDTMPCTRCRLLSGIPWNFANMTMGDFLTVTRSMRRN